MSLFGPNGEFNAGANAQGGAAGYASQDPYDPTNARGAESLLTRLSTGLASHAGAGSYKPQTPSNSYASGPPAQQLPYSYPPNQAQMQDASAQQQRAQQLQAQQSPYGLPPVAGSAALYPQQLSIPPPQGFPDPGKAASGQKKSRWVWVAVLVVLLCVSFALVVFLVMRGKKASGLAKKKGGRVRFDDDEDCDEDEPPSARRPARGRPGNPGGRGGHPSDPDSAYDRPILRGPRKTPAQIHHDLLTRDTHRDSEMRHTSGRSDRMRPEPGFEGSYPETDWQTPSGGPRPVEQPDGSFKLPPNADIPLPSELPPGTPLERAMPQPPSEPLPAGGGSSGHMPSPIGEGEAVIPTMGATPVADSFSTPVGGA